MNSKKNSKTEFVKRRKVLKELENKMKRPISLSYPQGKKGRLLFELKSSAKKNASEPLMKKPPSLNDLQVQFSLNQSDKSSTSGNSRSKAISSVHTSTISNSGNTTTISKKFKHQTSVTSAAINSEFELSNWSNADSKNVVETAELPKKPLRDLMDDIWDKLSISDMLAFKFSDDPTDFTDLYDMLSTNDSETNIDISAISLESLENQVIEPTISDEDDFVQPIPRKIETVFNYISGEVRDTNGVALSSQETDCTIPLSVMGSFTNSKRDSDDLPLEAYSHTSDNAEKNLLIEQIEQPTNTALIMGVLNSTINDMSNSVDTTHVFSCSTALRKLLNFMWLILIIVWFVLQSLYVAVRYTVMVCVFTYRAGRNIFRGLQFIASEVNRIPRASSVHINNMDLPSKSDISSSLDQPRFNIDQKEEGTRFLR